MRSSTKKKLGKDAEYLEYIRSLPCLVCAKRGVEQITPTEAAHVGKRGLSQKCSDRETIPLCGHHHRTGTACQHNLGKNFFVLHDIDREQVFAELQAQYKSSIEASTAF